MSDPSNRARRRRIAGERAPADRVGEPKRTVVRKPVRKSSSAKTREPHTGRPEQLAAADTPGVMTPTGEVVSVRRGRITAPPRGAFRWLVPLLVVAMAAIVFGAFFVVRGVGHVRDQRSIDGNHQAATAAAGRAAETIFSYNYQQLAKHTKDSKALMTPKFQKQYDAIDSELTSLATQTKAVILSKSREAAALPCGDSCSPSRASVLVFIDQAKENAGSTTPTVYGNRMVVDMARRNGKWLVDDIRAL